MYFQHDMIESTTLFWLQFASSELNISSATIGPSMPNNLEATNIIVNNISPKGITGEAYTNVIELFTSQSELQTISPQT